MRFLSEGENGGGGGGVRLLMAVPRFNQINGPDPIDHGYMTRHAMTNTYASTCSSWAPRDTRTRIPTPNISPRMEVG